MFAILSITLMNRNNPFGKSIFIILFTLFTCVSCSSDEPKINQSKEPSTEEPENKIEYYVKYESVVNIPISRVTSVDIEVKTEKGIQKMEVPKAWEGTFGPFNDLTALKIACTSRGYNENATNYTARIFICRGNQPFILKAEEHKKGTQYSLSYTVTKDDLK